MICLHTKHRIPNSLNPQTLKLKAETGGLHSPEPPKLFVVGYK